MCLVAINGFETSWTIAPECYGGVVECFPQTEPYRKYRKVSYVVNAFTRVQQEAK